MKLPREIEQDPCHEVLEKLLSQDVRPLWEKGKIGVPHIPFFPALETALKWALMSKQLERGIESIETLLRNEQKGLRALQEKGKATRSERVSRILIVPDDCTERFYRSCETILFHNPDRLLCFQVGVPHARLGQGLFSGAALVKALLVAEKAATVKVLFALAKALSYEISLARSESP